MSDNIKLTPEDLDTVIGGLSAMDREKLAQLRNAGSFADLARILNNEELATARQLLENTYAQLARPKNTDSII